ncbi:MAG: hypothetical protein ABS84_02110 [Rubrivivax sp. SCN 71-131]|nr:MAG: hypothetical protein ABS84_02110 [Rubrivivax sp. SCN 71-131]
MKIVIVLMLALVVAALAFAGVFMLRRRPDGADGERRMARALAVRVGLSAAVFLLVLLAWGMGWITPTGLPGGG